MSRFNPASVNRPLRIVLVDYVLEPDKPGRTGLSDIVWDMASVLVDLGHEPHIVASYATSAYPDPRVIVHNFMPPPMGYRNILGNLWLLKRAADIIKKLEPDIVHAPEYISTAVFATLRVDAPLVLTVPGNIYRRIKYGHSYERHYVYVLKWAARVSARRCSAVIATSQDMKRWWELTGSCPKRTPWIPYGVNTDRFHPIEGARRILGLPEDKLIFLYVGRFATEKGLLDLIDAVGLLSRNANLNNAEFILIGQGSMREKIQERIRAQKLDNVISLRDWVHQNLLAAWYSAADALVMPSWNEPFGKVMLESMACGTPVFASQTEGPLDHIIDGQNGLLFPPKSPECLAMVLQKAASGHCSLKEMGEQALRYVQGNLTWRVIAERTIAEVYTCVLRT